MTEVLCGHCHNPDPIHDPDCPNRAKRFNSQSYIANFGPHPPVDHDRVCPAELQLNDGRVWQCTSVIRAGRTKHARAHDFHGNGNP